MIRRLLVLAAILAGAVAGAPQALAQPRSGAWEVVVPSVLHCPRGFLCHAPRVYLEPNYGQAVKLEHELEATLPAGWPIYLEPTP